VIVEGERAARLREIARRSAVLPTPLLPTRQTISPGLTKRAILLKTFTSAVARMEIRNLKERLHHRSIKDRRRKGMSLLPEIIGGVRFQDRIEVIEMPANLATGLPRPPKAT
jgi:hypothetical protein